MSGRSESRVFLGFGGNLGDPALAVAAALRQIDDDLSCRVVTVSDLYETPPWGDVDQPNFLNACAELETTQGPRELLDLCLRTEKSLKRIRNRRWGPRTIDIDILLYGAEHLEQEGLQIPHPRMLERAFVLIPLAEIAPDLDLGGKSASLCAQSLDNSAIRRLGLDRNWWREENPEVGAI